MRICTECCLERPEDQFRERRDGTISRRCRQCLAAYHHSYHEGTRKKKIGPSFVSGYKAQHPFCADCGLAHPPWRLDFDHLPGFEKSFNVSKAVTKPMARILEEIAKCELVCANCHRDRTRQRRLDSKPGI